MALFSKAKTGKKITIRAVSLTGVGFLRDGNPAGYDPEELLKAYAQEITALMEAVLADDPDLDLKLAALIENMNDTMRTEIVKKIQDMVRKRDAEKASVIAELMQRQQEQEKAERKAVERQSWLSYFLSRDTLRKLREAFLARPALEMQIENIGQDLAKKGILQNVQFGDKAALGSLSTNVQQGKKQGQDQGRGV